MEQFQVLRENAKKKINFADHMLTRTYPLIGDPKMLLSVVENIFLALTNSMSSVLHYERTFKRIPPFEDNFNSKFNMFQSRITKKYSVDNKYVSLIHEVKEMIVQHRKSPMEFSRKDKLVICNDEYRMKIISVENIKGYINDAKNFIKRMHEITLKDEQIFDRYEVMKK